jgi:hypothetical protein
MTGQKKSSAAVLEKGRRAIKREVNECHARQLPFFLWMRLLTARKLQALHRRHLGVLARDVGREISLHQGALPEASSVSLAAQLVGGLKRRFS